MSEAGVSEWTAIPSTTLSLRGAGLSGNRAPLIGVEEGFTLHHNVAAVCAGGDTRDFPVERAPHGAVFLGVYGVDGVAIWRYVHALPERAGDEKYRLVPMAQNAVHELEKALRNPELKLSVALARGLRHAR